MWPSKWKLLIVISFQGVESVSKKIPDLTVVLITYNEEIHIERCIRSVLPVSKKIFIVDSYSTDNTVEIARSFGAEVVQRKWKNNHADQFQWGLDRCGSNTAWVMRMDADEYLEPGLQTEIAETLPEIPGDVAGIYIKRKVLFYGKWIKHGGFYPHILMRIWRNGLGRIEQRWMDEHVVLRPGARTITLDHDLVDDNHKGITSWVAKHNTYATREAVDLLNNRYPLFSVDDEITKIDFPQAKRKRVLKNSVYSRLPLFWRVGIYFFYRYALRLGFLDGIKGSVFHFMQGFWYRLLVDVKVMEIEKGSGGNIETMKKNLFDDYGIEL